MISIRGNAGAAFLLVLAACGQSADDTALKLPATPGGPAAASILRIPRGGGTVRLYLSPSLRASGWSALDEVPPVQRVIGADPEQGVAFMLDRAGTLISLDLETRRTRPQLRQVRAAAVGPDGVVYAADAQGSITQWVRRAPVRFRARLQGTPRELHATMHGGLLARVGTTKPELQVLAADQQASVPIPEGAIAIAYVGDLVAIATDTAVVLYSADPSRQPVSIEISEGARAAAFSPSGHLLYVAGTDDNITIIDRFGQEVLGEIDLPGPARDVRSDFHGRWLLVRPAQGDSIWVIDVGTRRYVGALPGSWNDDLPVVAAPNTVLIARGRDVVAVSLADPRFPETGRVENGARDFWVPIGWPQKGKLDVPVVAARDTSDTAVTPAVADSLLPAPEIYLQLSSSRNPAWADDLVANLRTAGLPASVLPPRREDDVYRVVLGPYATREEAEETSRGLGMPSFVITTQGE